MEPGLRFYTGWSEKDSRGRGVNEDLKEVRGRTRKPSKQSTGPAAGVPWTGALQRGCSGENGVRAGERRKRGGLRGPGHREPGRLSLGLQI